LQLLKEHIKELIRLSLHQKEVREALGDDEPTPYKGNIGNQGNQPQQPNNSQEPSIPPQNQPNVPQEPETPQDKETPLVYSVTLEQAANLIRGTKGKIFTVEFQKRTDGTNRVANGRLNVKRYLHGGVLKYNPWNYALIPFYDLNAGRKAIDRNGYRMINIPGIISLKISGIIYVTPNWSK